MKVLIVSLLCGVCLLSGCASMRDGASHGSCGAKTECAKKEGCCKGDCGSSCAAKAKHECGAH